MHLRMEVGDYVRAVGHARRPHFWSAADRWGSSSAVKAELSSESADDELLEALGLLTQMD